MLLFVLKENNQFGNPLNGPTQCTSNIMLWISQTTAGNVSPLAVTVQLSKNKFVLVSYKPREGGIDEGLTAGTIDFIYLGLEEGLFEEESIGSVEILIKIRWKSNKTPITITSYEFGKHFQDLYSVFRIATSCTERFVQMDDCVNWESQHEIETGNQIVEPPPQDFTPLSLNQRLEVLLLFLLLEVLQF